MIVKLARGACEGPGARCPFYYHDDEDGIYQCEHPQMVRKNKGEDVDLTGRQAGGYQKRHPDCPIKRVVVENK